MNCWEEREEMSPRRTLRQARASPRLDKRCQVLETRIAAFSALQKKRYAALGADILQFTKEVQEDQNAAEQHAQVQSAKIAKLSERSEQSLVATHRAQEELKHRLLERVTTCVQTIVNEREAQAEARSQTSKRLGEETQKDLQRLAEGFQAAERESETQTAQIIQQMVGAVRILRNELEELKRLHEQLSDDATEEIRRLNAAAQAEAQAESDHRAATEQRVLLLLEAACDKIDAMS